MYDVFFQAGEPIQERYIYIHLYNPSDTLTMTVHTTQHTHTRTVTTSNPPIRHKEHCFPLVLGL